MGENTKKISIIVPIYNVEEYLEQCIESLISQSFDDYEILLIDDGATDDSGKIADVYQERYPEIIRTFHKENGGLSDARNFGIPHAIGEYLYFVDSDDYLEKDVLSGLYQHAKNTRSDIVVFDYIQNFPTSAVIHEMFRKGTDDDYIFCNPNVFNKLFHRKIFVDRGFEFTKGIWYEDIALIPGLVAYNYKITNYPKPLYHYRMRENSIMQQKKYNPRFFEIWKAMECLSVHLSDKYYKELEFLTIHHAFYGLSLKILKYKEYKDMDRARNLLIEKFPDWKANRYYRQKGKIFMLYCSMLERRWYGICRLFIRLKESVKDAK